MTAIVFTSDLHVHPYRVGSRDAGADRLRDGVAALRATLQHARVLRAPWVFGGDMKVPKQQWVQDALNAVLAAMREYGDVEKWMIPGNHDGVDGEWGSGLSPFDDVAHVVDVPTVGQVYGVPVGFWPYGGHRMNEYGAFLEKARRAKAATLVAHVYARDVMVGPRDTVLSGTGVPVDDLLGGVFQRALLGDIHKAQVCDATGRWRAIGAYGAMRMARWRAIYPGSPYQQDVGEAGETCKGALAVDLDAGSFRMLEVKAPVFRVHDFSGGEASSVANALRSLAKDAGADDMIRVTVDAPLLGRDATAVRDALKCLRDAVRSATVIPRRPRATRDDGGAQPMTASMSPVEMIRKWVESHPLDGVSSRTLRLAGERLLAGEEDVAR